MIAPVHTRAEAATLGLAKYSTGRPCRRGHGALRYTASGACVACVVGYHTRWQRGRTALTVMVHPDDRPAVQALVDALAVARALA